MEEKSRTRWKTCKAFSSTQGDIARTEKNIFNVSNVYNVRDAEDNSTPMFSMPVMKTNPTPRRISVSAASVETQESIPLPRSNVAGSSSQCSPKTYLRSRSKKMFIMGCLVTLAFIFSLINLCLTLNYMSTRGGCNCREADQSTPGKLLVSFFLFR